MKKLVDGQADMSGAMNIISMGRTIAKHDSVRQLIEGGPKLQIESD